MSDVPYERRAVVDQVTLNKIIELERKFDRLEYTQTSAVKNLDEHDKDIKAVTQVAIELKQVADVFKAFIESQKETNKVMLEGLKKSTDFQNKFVIGASILVVLWQVFGTRLFSLVQVSGAA